MIGASNQSGAGSPKVVTGVLLLLGDTAVALADDMSKASRTNLKSFWPCGGDED